KHLLLNHFARVNERSARCYGIWTVDYFIGVSYTAHMTFETIQAGLRATPCGSVEVLLHPTVGPDRRDERCSDEAVKSYAASSKRATELQALRLPALREFLQKEGWKAMSYNAWSQMQQHRQPAESRPEIPAGVHEVSQAARVPA